MNLTQNRGAGDAGKYALCGHPQAGLTMLEVNALYDLAKMISVGTAAGNLMIQRFKYVIPAGDTTDKVFTSTVDQMEVIGGWVSIANVDDDYDIDIGITDDVTSLVNDLITKVGDEVDGEVPVALEFLTSGKDVTITVSTNANSEPVTVEIALLCHKLVTS